MNLLNYLSFAVGVTVFAVLYRAMGKRAQAAFTLVELIITLILASILLGLGVPAFVDLVDSNRMIAVTNELVGEMQYARNEAIRAITAGLQAQMDIINDLFPQNDPIVVG